MCHNAFFPLLVLAMAGSAANSFSAKTHLAQQRLPSDGQYWQQAPPSYLFQPLSASGNNIEGDGQKSPLCDLQTLLRLAGCVQTGGSAKNIIQSGECSLNGIMETRRGKKLYPGDVITFRSVDYSVDEIVAEKGYVYKSKQKKVKPAARQWIDKKTGETVKEFGGRYRNKEWRAERKDRKRASWGDDEWKEEQQKKKMAEKRSKRKSQAEQLREYLDSMADGSSQKKRLLRKSRAFKVGSMEAAMDKEESQEEE